MEAHNRSTANAVAPLDRPRAPALSGISPLVAAAGPADQNAWGEFFSGQIRNRHTRVAYLHAVRCFLTWAEPHVRDLNHITPGMIGQYFDRHSGSLPTKKLHQAALRSFFRLLVTRHILVLNPADSVRGERYRAVEGKTPEITPDQARALLKTIDGSSPAQAPRPGHRRHAHLHGRPCRRGGFAANASAGATLLFAGNSFQPTMMSGALTGSGTGAVKFSRRSLMVSRSGAPFNVHRVYFNKRRLGGSRFRALVRALQSSEAQA